LALAFSTIDGAEQFSERSCWNRYLASRGAGDRGYRTNTDFWAAIAAALNRSSLVWILAILALLTWVAWHTNETLLLIFLRVVLETGRFLFVCLT
jgi:hypothetical protein